jgi:hypothetical protein
MSPTELPPHIRTITSPVDRTMLRELARDTVVQFPNPLTDRGYRKVARLLDGRPEVTLRAHGSKFTDVEFLRFFPEVRRFQIDYAHKLESLDGYATCRRISNRSPSEGRGARNSSV